MPVDDDRGKLRICNALERRFDRIAVLKARNFKHIHTAAGFLMKGDNDAGVGGPHRSPATLSSIA